MIAVQVVVSGLLLGAVYALFSSGLTLIWGMMNVVDFAHGDFVMLGMYIAFGLAAEARAWQAQHCTQEGVTGAIAQFWARRGGDRGGAAGSVAVV